MQTQGEINTEYIFGLCCSGRWHVPVSVQWLLINIIYGMVGMQLNKAKKYDKLQKTDL